MLDASRARFNWRLYHWRLYLTLDRLWSPIRNEVDAHTKIAETISVGLIMFVVSLERSRERRDAGMRWTLREVERGGMLA
jgi:hypothetical protein